jgi:hypothetical protein
VSGRIVARALRVAISGERFAHCRLPAPRRATHDANLVIPPIDVMTRAIVAAITFVVSSLGAAVAFAADRPASCSSAEYRQFDFWVGEWDVADPTGKSVGHNRITAIHDGCGLQEQWSTPRGYGGTSLNGYDSARKVWHQTWVDSMGNVLLLDGRFAEGRMTLAGTTPRAEGGTDLQRITWTPQADGRVRQLWESSGDGGQSWKVVFDGWYSRVR